MSKQKFIPTPIVPSFKPIKHTTMSRKETQENKFGLTFKVGQKFTLHRPMGKRGSEETCSIREISPSGLFF